MGSVQSYSNSWGTIGIFSEQSPDDGRGHVVNFEIGVDQDMIVVGGGIFGHEESGKLITASYPKADLSKWIVSAKDHLVTDGSPIVGYAIGLKVKDPFRGGNWVDPIVLMKYIHLTSQTSLVVSHPEAKAPQWPRCCLLGGGFQVNYGGAGNLGTASYPDTGFGIYLNSNEGWVARSKDHLAPDPASVTCYAVSLEKHMLLDDGKGYHGYEANSFYLLPATATGVHPTKEAWVSSDTREAQYILTGGGANVRWEGSGPGNLLWLLEPILDKSGAGYRQGFRAASKDHLESDSCDIDIYAIGLALTTFGQ